MINIGKQFKLVWRMFGKMRNRIGLMDTDIDLIKVWRNQMQNFRQNTNTKLQDLEDRIEALENP